MEDNGHGCGCLNACLFFLLFWFVLWLLGTIFWGPLFFVPEIRTKYVPEPVPVPERQPSPEKQVPPTYVPPLPKPTPQPKVIERNTMTVWVVSPNNQYQAYGYRDGTVKLVQFPLGEPVWISYGKDNGNNSVNSVDFTSDSRVMATSDNDGLVIIWLVNQKENETPIYWKFITAGEPVDHVEFADNNDLWIWMRNGNYKKIYFRINFVQGQWVLEYSQDNF